MEVWLSTAKPSIENPTADDVYSEFTDDDGRVSFDGGSEGLHERASYWIHVAGCRASGPFSAGLRGAVVSVEPLDGPEKRPFGWLTGSVTGPDDRPVASGRVETRGQAAIVDAVEIRDGAFRVPLRDAKELSVRVVGAAGPKGPYEGLARPRWIDLSDRLDSVSLTLSAGFVLSGRVVDPDGKAVPRVPVVIAEPDQTRFHAWRESDPWFRSVTDSGGRFRADGLARGNVGIWVESPNERWRAPPATVVDTAVASVEIRLERAAVIAGRVVGPRGEPIPLVKVSLLAPKDREGRDLVAEATTDIEGSFRIGKLDPTDAVRMDVAAVGSYVGTSVSDVAPGREDLVVRLNDGVFIEGDVFDGEGKPLRFGAVYAWQGEPAPFPDRRTYADMQGVSNRIRIGPLSPGTYRLAFSQAGGLYNEEDVAPCEVRAPTSGLRIVVTKRGSIRGRLVGDDVAGFSVRWWPIEDGGPGVSPSREAIVESDGAFVLDGPVDTGPGVLTAEREGDPRYARLEGERILGKLVELTLVRGLSISGRVVLGDPRGSRKGTAYAGGSAVSATARIAPDGTFRIAGLPEGSYEVSFWLDEGEHGRLSEVAAGASGIEVPEER